jgi:Nucleotidyl transferase AbiEii toxin, Type IV TA system
MFRPRLDILPPPQRQLWEELDQVPVSFVLYGGTALALRLGHRVSEDFDFFSNEPFTPPDLERDVTFLKGAVRLQASPNTLVSAVERAGTVKVSFFGNLGLRRVQDPERSEVPGLRIASLLDLAATKVKVVQDRAEAKDYMDIDRLLEEGIDLGQALGAARSVYGPSFNPLLSVKALCYFGDGDLGSLPAEVRTRLAAAAAQSVDPTRLPEVPALPGGLRP